MTMKFPILAAALLLAPLLMTQTVRAQATPPPAGAPPQGEEPKTQLQKDMDQISSAVKKLRHQIDDASRNASSLDLVAQIRSAASDAAGQTPSWAAEKPEADRAKFVADFQSDIKEFIGKVDALAGALKADDNAGAAKGLKELFAAEHQGHKEFRKPKPQQ